MGSIECYADQRKDRIPGISEIYGRYGAPAAKGWLPNGKGSECLQRQDHWRALCGNLCGLCQRPCKRFYGILDGGGYPKPCREQRDI